MYTSISNQVLKGESNYVKTSEIGFLGVMVAVSAVLYYCLVNSTSVPLVCVAIPLCLYDRAYIFPMMLTMSMCQGAFQEVQVTGSGATQDASYSESLIIAAVSPMLFYDLTQKRSRIVPLRFVMFYAIFIWFVIQGIIVYYQYPDNYKSLIAIGAKNAPKLHAIMKTIKIIFYLFYLRVLINYPVEKNLKTLEYMRRFMPFVLIILGLNLLLNGRSQSGAGYSGTLQMGDAHHGSFTSMICAMGIYSFVTLFKPKVSIITRVFNLAAIASIGFAIMMMGSRNGLLSFGLLCMIGFLINLHGKTIDFKFLMVVAAFFAGVVAILLSLDSPTLQRAIYMTDTAGGGDRVYYWEAGAKALSEHPIFGMGGDESAAQAAVGKYAPPGVQDKVMHNTYLEMAVEYGLIAAIFYFCFLFFALTWSYRLYKYAHATNNLVIAAPGISYLILMVAACFISDVWDTAIWYNLSVIFALAIQLVYYQYINKKNIDTKASFASYFGR